MRKSNIVPFLLCANMLCSLEARAGDQVSLPSYVDFQLKARASFEGNYNFPAGASLTSQSVAINNHGEIALGIATLSSEEDISALWVTKHGQGEVVYREESGQFIISSDVSLNDNGDIAFYEFDPGISNGVFIYDNATGSVNEVLRDEGKVRMPRSPKMNNDGSIAFIDDRGKRRLVASLKYDDKIIELASNALASGPYAHVYTPAINQKSQVALKLDVGKPSSPEGPKGSEIRLFRTDGSSTLIAQDHRLNAASTMGSFSNSLALNADGWVLFSAHDQIYQGQAIYLSNGSQTVTIAKDHTDGVEKISAFLPALNNKGLVAFRANDKNGMDTIFVSNGHETRKVIGAGDVVKTDQGLAKLASSPSDRVFRGSPTLNDHGDLAFLCDLTHIGNGHSLGTAIVVAKASLDE